MLYRQTLLYLPAQALGPVLQLVAAVAWTFFLVPEEMGVLALLASAQELIFTATLQWFSFYTMRFHEGGTTGAARSRFLDTEAGAMLWASVAASVAVSGLALVVDATWTQSLFGAALVYTVSRGVATQLADRARTEHDWVSYSILQIVWPLLGLAFGLVLVTLYEASAAAVLWGYAGAQLVALGAALVRLKMSWRGLAVDRTALVAGLVYGLPLVAGTVFIWLAANGLRFLVQGLDGAAAVGLMTVGWGLGQRAAAFAAMLVTAAAFPIAMRRAREEGFEMGQAQLVANGVLLIGVLAPVTAGLWAITGPIVDLFVAAPFREVTKAVLPLALLGGALRNLRMHFGEQIFLLHARPLVPLANDAFDAVATLGLAAAGHLAGGLEGAVAGAALGSGASLAVTLLCGRRAYGFALPLVPTLKIALSAAAMAIGVVLLAPGASLLSLGAAVVAGVLLYAAALAVAWPREAAWVGNRIAAALGLFKTQKEIGAA
jgi:O-antigen/teichoic acid export membrane protein